MDNPSEINLDLQRLRIAIPADHDATKPFQLKLIKEGSDAEYQLWATGSGDQVYTTLEHAENSMKLQSSEYKEQNRKRSDLARLVRATAVKEDNNMVTLDGDEYYPDVADMLERLGDDVVVDGENNLPAWCYTTRRDGFDFDIENSLESYMSDNHHEGATDEIKDYDWLVWFFKQWKSKQTVSTFYIDYQRIIVIDQERYERELAEAKAWLEANAHG